MGIQFVIGETNLSEIPNAVIAELDNNVFPTVSNTQLTGKRRDFAMCRYAGLYLQECIRRRNGGNFRFNGEGCKIYARYSEDETDRFLGISIKTTTSSRIYKMDGREYKGYHFNLDKYDGCLIYFKVLTEPLQWLIPHDIIRQTIKTKSFNIMDNVTCMERWHPYLVNAQNLDGRMHRYYTHAISAKLTYKNLASLTLPTSKTQQIELNYRRKLDVIKPYDMAIVDGLKYDFTLDGIRIQEKTIHIRNHRGAKEVNIRSSSMDIRYTPTEFDVLLAHLPDPYGQRFYFIPMSELVKHNIIKVGNCKGKEKFQVFPPEIIPKPRIQSKTWANVFLFRYDIPNIRQIIIDVYRASLP